MNFNLHDLVLLLPEDFLLLAVCVIVLVPEMALFASHPRGRSNVTSGQIWAIRCRLCLSRRPPFRPFSRPETRRSERPFSIFPI